MSNISTQLPPLCIYDVLYVAHTHYSNPFCTREQQLSIYFFVSSLYLLYKQHGILRKEADGTIFFYHHASEQTYKFSY